MSINKAQESILINNPKIKVMELRFAPGASTGHHRHNNDYLVVPITSGQLSIANDQGQSHRELMPGVPYFRESGVEHDVSNETDNEIVFIEIELK